MSQSTSSTNDCIDVLPAHQFDQARLEQYLLDNLPDFRAGISVQQFQGGMSNPTFRVADGNGKVYVMRKKPPGKLLPSAHAVDREFRVIAALGKTDVPVPQAALLCEDDDVVGTAFYLMEHVLGRVFLDPALPDLEPRERTDVYYAMNAALAKLHAVQPDDVGLSNFGRQGGYCTRQIKRWTTQYVATKTDEVPAIDALMKWLPEHLPSEDLTGIAHGDYRLGNMVFDPQESKVLAILDWELSTLGHPYADLAYNCLAYYVPNATRGDLTEADLDGLGIPPEAAYLQAYCQARGLDEIRDWTFYLVLSLFRLAAITQGVYFRGVQGNASDPSALERKGNCERLANIAWRLAQEA